LALAQMVTDQRETGGTAIGFVSLESGFWKRWPAMQDAA